jgi:hypothetical protein
MIPVETRRTLTMFLKDGLRLKMKIEETKIAPKGSANKKDRSLKR